MGNCCGGSRKQSGQTNNVNKHRARREQTWQATGTIALRDSNLKELPSSVSQVGSAARTLDATNNRLTSLPTYLSSLTSLQRLIVASNQLTALPNDISALKSLKVLILDFNRLTDLPADIGTLTKLEKLCVSQNALTGLPSTFGRLQSLTVLKLVKNKLSAVPDQIGECTSLEEVDLSDNYLQELPESLGSLSRLKMLAADQNRIASVAPALFKGCTSLQTLALHENPITIEMLEATEGYDLLEQRRRSKFDKQIANGVLLSKGGLDEGVDRNLKVS